MDFEQAKARWIDIESERNFVSLTDKPVWNPTALQCLELRRNCRKCPLPRFMKGLRWDGKEYPCRMPHSVQALLDAGVDPTAALKRLEFQNPYTERISG